MRHQLAFCVLITIFVACCKVLLAAPQIQFQLISYENPKHRLSNGRCCEEGLEKDCVKGSNGRCINCTMECDPQFKIDVKHNGNVIYNVTTETLIYKDNFNFTDFKSNFENPFTVNTSSYRGLFELLISSYDDDEHLGIDLIDSASLEFNTTTVQPNIENIRILNGKVTATKVSIRFICDPDTYGKYCEQFCKPRNDDSGHFNCDQATGDKVCLPRWTSPDMNCTVLDVSYVTPSPTVLQSTMAISTQLVSSSIISMTVDQKSVLLVSTLAASNSQEPYTPVIKTQVKDSFTAFTTAMPTQILSSTRSLSKETNTVTENSVKTVSIKPTRSYIAPMTSIKKCTRVETIEYDITLKAELSPNQVNETLLEIVCMEVNKECYNVDEQCQQSTVAGRISLQQLRIKGDFEMNDTAAFIKLKIRSANGTCTSNFAACTESSILESKRLKTLLGVEEVTLCKKYGGCTSQIIKTEDTSNPTDEDDDLDGGIIAGIVCAVIGTILLILGILYARKKQMMKVQDGKESEKQIIKNEEVVSSTSQC